MKVKVKVLHLSGGRGKRSYKDVDALLVGGFVIVGDRIIPGDHINEFLRHGPKKRSKRDAVVSVVKADAAAGSPAAITTDGAKEE